MKGYNYYFNRIQLKVNLVIYSSAAIRISRLNNFETKILF